MAGRQHQILLDVWLLGRTSGSRLSKVGAMEGSEQRTDVT